MAASYRDSAGRIFSGNNWGSVQDLQQEPFSGSFKSITRPVFAGKGKGGKVKKAGDIEESPSANAESTTPMDDSASSMEEFPELQQLSAMEEQQPTPEVCHPDTNNNNIDHNNDSSNQSSNHSSSHHHSSSSNKDDERPQKRKTSSRVLFDEQDDASGLFHANGEPAIITTELSAMEEQTAEVPPPENDHNSDNDNNNDNNSSGDDRLFREPSRGLQDKRSDSSIYTREETSIKNRPRLERSSEQLSKHVLISTERGESSIEQLSNKIDKRRENRIEITGNLRAQFVKECRKIAAKRGKKMKHKMHMDDLLTYRKEVLAQAVQYDSSKQYQRFVYHELFGNLREHDTKLRVIDKAIREMMEVEGDWFHYADFVFYNTRIPPRGGLFTRSPTTGALQLLFLFYLFSAIFFCKILKDEDICPVDPTGQNRSYYGWLTTIYFASVTMSTVGYGDISFAKVTDNPWRVYLGTVFILASMVMGYTVFAAAGNATLQRFGDQSKLSTYIVQKFSYDGEHIPLYKQIRIICLFRIAELVLLFIFFVSVGVFAARFAIRYSDDPAHNWSWMTTYYWAVQTVTTVGYGDVNMPFELRWFQIFYTTLGTALVGSVFAGVANLKSELNDLRRYYAWKRRQLSKRLIEDMKGGNSDDDKIDQYEFMVGSLLTLGKISQSDVEQIMDQFRKLAGKSGYIEYSDETVDDSHIEETEDDFVWDLAAADDDGEMPF